MKRTGKYLTGIALLRAYTQEEYERLGAIHPVPEEVAEHFSAPYKNEDEERLWCYDECSIKIDDISTMHDAGYGHVSIENSNNCGYCMIGSVQEAISAIYYNLEQEPNKGKTK